MSVKILHASDLHLSDSDVSEREYGLAVLEELVAQTLSQKADLLLLAGDIFDTHKDLQALAGAFSQRLGPLKETPVVMIPGNHELLPRKTLADIPQNILAPVNLLTGPPFEVFRPQGLPLEIIGFPFQKDFSGYLEWEVPPKDQEFRVGVLHGVVNTMTFTGLSEEEDQSVIDADLFTRFKLDYAALGHIHARGENTFGHTLAHYPGSARVWRRGETGPRRATLVTLSSAGVKTKEVVLARAGQYQELALTLDEEGAIWGHSSVAEAMESSGCGPQDWLQVNLNGFVDSADQVQSLLRLLEAEGADRFRRFQVETEEIITTEKLRGHPLVKAFDQHWGRARQAAEAAADSRELALLERARKMALTEINRFLEE